MGQAIFLAVHNQIQIDLNSPQFYVFKHNHSDDQLSLLKLTVILLKLRFLNQLNLNLQVNYIEHE